MSDKRIIYMDNAATTAVRGEVLDAMLPYFTLHYGNPSSIHSVGRDAKRAVESARKQVAAAIGAQPQEVYFTSGGSESDNWALRSIAEMLEKKGKHIITSSVEHHAVLHTCEYLEKHRGYRITYLPVDEFGSVSIDELKKAIRPDTILISVMFANNEIGTIQPIREIGEIVPPVPGPARFVPVRPSRRRPGPGGEDTRLLQELPCQVLPEVSLPCSISSTSALWSRAR